MGKLATVVLLVGALLLGGVAHADWTKPVGRYHISVFTTRDKHSRISKLRVRTRCLAVEDSEWHYVSYDPDFATATLGC